MHSLSSAPPVYIRRAHQNASGSVVSELMRFIHIHAHVHQSLAAELGSSRSFVQEIRNDSSDIVEVIRLAFEVSTVHVI